MNTREMSFFESTTANMKKKEYVCDTRDAVGMVIHLTSWIRSVQKQRQIQMREALGQGYISKEDEAKCFFSCYRADFVSTLQSQFRLSHETWNRTWCFYLLFHLSLWNAAASCIISLPNIAMNNNGVGISHFLSVCRKTYQIDAAAGQCILANGVIVGRMIIH